MPAISLIATDLDGTLLNGEGTLSPRTVAAVRRATAAGVTVVLATTHLRDAVRGFCDTLGLQDPIICANGALVLGAPYGELWASHTIPRAAALQVAQLADRNGWELSVTVGTMTYLRQRPGQSLGPLSATIRIVPTNAAGVVGDPIRILTWHPEAIAALRELCQEQLSAACYAQPYWRPDGGVHSLGIFTLGADKGSALALVQRKLGVRREEVMAMGDNENDLPLFAQAGTRIAVANATEAVQRRATAVAPGHDEDGAAWAIEQVVRGNDQDELPFSRDPH